MLMDRLRYPDGFEGLDLAEPRISVVVPLADWNDDARRCVDRLTSLLGPADECILAPDGFWLTEELPDRFRAAPIAAHGGPAIARNAGAAVAVSDVIFFVDADVLLAHDAIEIVRSHFRQADLAAVFGSYDDAPSVATAVSRFRNLLHHFQHQSHAGPARTFWTGCGAIRRSAFEALGGFSVRYDRPAMEDIELGARLSRSGGAIRLDPALLCKHLKRWTLRSMIVTDIRDRAIPWARLIYREGKSIAVLNADRRGRLSLVLTAIMGASLVLGLIWPSHLLVTLAAWLALLLNERAFLALLRRVGGVRLLSAGALLLPLHLLSGAIGFGYVTLELALQHIRNAVHVRR